MGLPFYGLWEDASAAIKPCSYVGVFGRGTVQLFRMQLGILHCTVFSNSPIGNSVQVLVEACHFASSHTSLRHLKLVPVPDRMFCLFQWAPSFRSHHYLATATYRSRDFVTGTIASFSWYLDLFLHFSAPWEAFSGFMLSSLSSRLMLCRNKRSS